MQLANRLDIQLRSVVEWQELFHPDAILLRQRYINFIFLQVSCFYRFPMYLEDKHSFNIGITCLTN